MCRPSKIGRCVDLRRPMIDVNYVATLAQNIDGIVVYMRIAPRVWTSVLSFKLV